MTTLRLTEKDNGRRCEVAIGTEIHLLLPENPTTGFRWELDSAFAPHLESTAPVFEAASNAAGSGGTRRFGFIAKNTGEIKLRARLCRPWEGDRSITARFAATLVISRPDETS